MNTLPNDPAMLLSAVNMKLRDFYSDLGALCADLGESRTEIEEKLASIGYTYDEKANRFV